MKTANFPIKEFQEISQANPYWSSWVCFCEAIKGKKNLSKKTIKKYFEKLVSRNDYARNERRELLGYLYLLASQPEECR
jgi:hypothetical protein